MQRDAPAIQPDDPRISWQGAVSLERSDGWVRPWRIPVEDRLLFLEPLRERASMPAGVRIAFRGDVQRIEGTIEPDADLTQIDPDAAGYQIMGRNFVREVADVFFT